MKSASYPFYLRLVHWASVITLLIGVVAVLIREELEGKPLKRLLLMTHQTMGLAIICLLIVRLWFLMRYRQQLPNHPLPVPILIVAKMSHGLLYLCLLATPLIGWAYVSAKGQPPVLLGLLPLPALVAEDMDSADTLSDLHAWIAYGFLMVIALHVMAALWHHLVKKDGVLLSMWPK